MLERPDADDRPSSTSARNAPQWEWLRTSLVVMQQPHHNFQEIDRNHPEWECGIRPVRCSRAWSLGAERIAMALVRVSTIGLNSRG